MSPVILLFISTLPGQELVVNHKADHNNIINIIVMDSKGNPAEWEMQLIKQGYDVITRNKIDLIINEKALQFSGLAEDDTYYKAGELIGANAILEIKRKMLVKYTLRLISTKTGQILFIANSGYLKGDELEKWKNDLFVNYKAKI